MRGCRPRLSSKSTPRVKSLLAEGLGGGELTRGILSCLRTETVKRGGLGRRRAKTLMRPACLGRGLVVVFFSVSFFVVLFLSTKTSPFPSSVICFSFLSVFPPFLLKSPARSWRSCGVFSLHIPVRSLWICMDGQKDSQRQSDLQQQDLK